MDTVEMATLDKEMAEERVRQWLTVLIHITGYEISLCSYRAKVSKQKQRL